MEELQLLLESKLHELSQERLGYTNNNDNMQLLIFG